MIEVVPHRGQIGNYVQLECLNLILVYRGWSEDKVDDDIIMMG